MASRCPACGLINPDRAILCDCGHQLSAPQTEAARDFVDARAPADQAYAAAKRSLRRELVQGVVALVVAAGCGLGLFAMGAPMKGMKILVLLPFTALAVFSLIGRLGRPRRF